MNGRVPPTGNMKGQKLMKPLNKRKKVMITALTTATLIDLWRDWRWAKKIASIFKDETPKGGDAQ
jgi:hypothetical protein